jgi:hypothetical protein
MRAFTLFLLASAFASAAVAITDRPVTKVVKLLQGMIEKSKADGERDTELFAKYKCYCDSNAASKTKAIAENTEAIALLAGEIAALQGENGQLSGEHAQLEFDMSDNERARATADSLRTKANEAFVAEETDMEAAIGQMNQAIDTLAAIGADQTANSAGDNEKFMAGRNDGPVLIKLRTDVKKAMDAASIFLTQKQKKSVSSFLQAPFAGTYTSQSGEIVGILKNMRDTFKSNLASARASEKSDLEAYSGLTKIKQDEFAKQKTVHTEADAVLGENDNALSTKKTQKKDAETSKANDEEFLAKLNKICADNTAAYEDRKMVRANEDAAISQAISILNSDAAFDNMGSVGSTNFLQLNRKKRQEPRDDVSKQMLKDAGTHKSGRLAKVAVGMMLGNPFDKVVEELEEMIEIIAKEEKADDEQKAWCDSEREENHAQKSDKESTMSTLDGQITSHLDTLDSDVDGLRKQLRDEEESLAQNRKDQADSIADRSEENAAYQANIANLVEAAKTVAKATKVLTKFYDWLHAKNGAHHYDKKAGKDSGGSNIKRISEASVSDLEEACSADPSCNGFNTDGWLKTKIVADDKLYDSTADLYVKVFDEENSVGLIQRREDPAPPETFSSESGSQKEKGGDVVSQLQFILSETHAEEQQAHTDEEASQHNFEDEITTLKSQEATHLETIASLQESVADEEKALLASREDHKKTTAERDAIKKYLFKIAPGCTFITTNIDTRKANREAETTSLQNSVDKLKSTPQYKEAKAKADKEALGACAEKCVGAMESVECKACQDGTSVSGYCAAHADADGC